MVEQSTIFGVSFIYGVKATDSGNDVIYVIIAQEKIKKSDVTEPAGKHKKKVQPSPVGSLSLNVNIAQLLKKINSFSTIISVPNQLLSEDGKLQKEKAVLKAEKAIVKKNNDHFKGLVDKNAKSGKEGRKILLNNPPFSVYRSSAAMEGPTFLSARKVCKRFLRRSSDMDR